MNQRSRKANRLSGFDYSSSGQYFITICTYLKAPLLGRFMDGQIMNTDIGSIVEECWLNLSTRYSNVQPGVFAVMPNHFHGVVTIQKQNDISDEAIIGLPDIIRNIKAFTAYSYYKQSNYRKLWQRGYYERIIRDEKELNIIEDYIKNNPTTWQRDKYYLV